MMKHLRYTVAIVAAMVIGLPMWAQTPTPGEKPAIIERDPEVARITPAEIPYEWREKFYSESGEYHDTVFVDNNDVPDTAFTLMLYIKEYIHMPEETAKLYPSQGQYSWHGKLWPVKDTTYVDTVVAIGLADPDTICSLKMVLKQYFEYAPEIVTKCQTEPPYYWRGKKYHETGIHTDTIKAENFADKDTVYTLRLTVGVPFQEVVNFRLCPGETVTYRDRTYDKEVTDTISLSSFTGCDSIYIVRIDVGASSMKTSEEHFCDGETFVWQKSTGEVELTQPGYYYDSLKNNDGCDSIICLHLTYSQPYFRKDTMSLCEDELPYQFGKLWLNESGTYYDTIRNGYEKCMHIVQLNFTVLKNTYEEKTIQFCTGTGVRHNEGEIFYDSRVYIDTVYSAGEVCYHIIKTIYTPGPTYKMEEWKHRSVDEPSILWHGEQRTKDGLYTDRHENTEGCDSIWILHLMTDYHMFADTNICSGDTIFYKNHAISSDTTVVDSLVSAFGGDSLVHMHFTFIPRYYFREQTTICTNEYMPWPGHEHIMLHEPGMYFDRYQTQQGCDSIFEINVLVNPVYSNDTTVYVSAYRALDELPVTWIDGHGKSHDLYNDTVLIDTLGHTPSVYNEDHQLGDIWYRALSGGCDSTKSIHLYIIRKYSFDTLYLCPNGKVIVDGRTYTETGDYEHWLTASIHSTYLDSIHYFHITDAPDYHNDVWDVDTVCQNELPYSWKTRLCTRAGEYYDTVPSAYGCDSVVKLKLFVKPSYLFYIQKTICEGDSFYINGRHITKSGIVYDSLVTHLGCDSVYKIVVNVARRFYYSDTAYIAQGGIYTWHKNGQPWILTKPGVYYDSCQTVVDGCDSIYYLKLLEDKHYYFYDTARICANELPYKWHNHVIYESGDFQEKLSTVRGRDSIYSLNLTVYPKYLLEKSVQLCPTEQMVISGQTITKSGTYTDSLTTVNGCDSIILYHISLVSDYLIDEQKHMGPNISIEWHGKTITKAGVYMDSLQTVNGCDSVYRLTLIDDPTYHIYDTVRICRSETPYRWHGEYYYNSCDATHPYMSRFQMDSIYYLHLTVDPTYEQIRHEDRCQGDYFLLNNRKITQSGTYSDTLNTRVGCDSITHYIVNFHPIFMEHDTMRLINGSSVTWHDQVLTQAGTYFDSALTNIGCDSIYQLELYLADTFSMVENVIACEEDLPYKWHGQNLMQTGRYSDRRTSIHNADSTYYINFMVAPKYEMVQNVTICHGGTVSVLGRTYTRPGEYRDTLLSQYGCDSILTVRVNWSAEKFSEQNISLCYGQSYVVNDRTFSKSGVYTDTIRTMDGCDSVVRYNVQVASQYLHLEEKEILPGTSYIWQGHLQDRPLTQAGIYRDSLVATDGCDSIFVLKLSIKIAHLIKEEKDVCANDLPYFWHGRNYATSGTYYDSLSTKQLTDSIYCLILNVRDTTIRDVYYDYCSNETAHIGTKTYRNSTSFYDTIPSQYGCPQITRYVLRFHPIYTIERTKILAEGETYQFFDTLITQPGIYRHYASTQYGCDSTVTLTVSYCMPKAPTIMHLKLCSGDTMILGDTAITTAGTYTRNYPNRYGCDSVVRYVVQAFNTYHWTSYASFCSNESYTWFGHLGDTVLTKSGRYDEYFRTVDGCDSVYSLILTAKPAYITDTIIYRCKDEVPYMHRGKLYDTNQTFTDTLRSIGGCDSLAVTRYILNDHCSDWDLYTRCQGEELIVDNRQIENDGEHRIQIGVDSVHRFNVLSWRKYEYNVHLNSTCDSMVYQGETYYARGIGQETFTVDRMLHSIHGCDSIEHVTMTLYQSAQNIPHTEVIYDYSSVLFGGQIYNQTGTYVHEYHTTHGCDSTMVLNLVVIPTDSTGAKQYHYCYNSKQNLEIFGKLYHPTQDTIIFDTTAIPDVGMWIIKKAIVRVSYPFTITSLHTTSELCADNNMTFSVQYDFNGSFPDRYELEFLPSQLSVTPSLQSGKLYDKNTFDVTMDGGGICVAPGVYPYRVQFLAEDCHMSDTTIYSSIYVHYPSSIMEANWTDMVALVNQEHNVGRWEFLPPFNWEIKTESGQDKTALIAPSASLPYLYTSYLEPGDRVTITMLRTGYNQPVSSCEYIFYPVASSEKIPILIYPTAARKASQITIESPTDGQYSLYNNAGQRISMGEFVDGKQLVEMPNVEGAYILYLQPKNEGIQVKKIVVY